MITAGLKQLLEGLNLLSNKAVFFSNEEDGEIFTSFPSETQKKLDIIQPDAFFVFNDRPYILFFDLSDKQDILREQKIHKQVWSFDYSPLIFIVKNNEVQIFNAFSYDKRKNQLQEIKLSDAERNEKFSFWNLQSGESWKWLQIEYYKTTIQKKRVNQKLFENIKLVREILTDKSKEHFLSDDEANILILRLIFIRYLIDRNVKMDLEYISGDTILERRKSFSELIEKPRKLNQFFEQLNNKFNGVLFKDIKVQLSKPQATYLSWVFTGMQRPNMPDLFAGTDYYFEIFDFSIIPVEVISGIYESLISDETRNEHSAVYTPSFLVEYVISETVDKYLQKNKTSECKIFDPSCGSGIFLVQSYRRMVDKEKKMYGEKVKKNRLKEIAQNNLFGVDLNEQALKVTCFSIYIALLDYQDPKSILVNFHFPILIGENLFGANFFDTEHEFNNVIKAKEIDFILGNPPWKNGGKDKDHVKYLKNNELINVVSDYQLAQSFILRTSNFTSTKTICSLIVTSKAIYNSNALAFKRYFLENYFLYKCLDLSAVSTLIFEKAINPAIVLTYKFSNKKYTLGNIVKHESVKQNIFAKHFKMLLMEKNDRKEIKQSLFYEKPWMFKVALYAGTLDYAFLTRLCSITTKISGLVDSVELHAGDGIKRLTLLGESKLKTKPPLFKEIENIPIVETGRIKKYYTPVDKEYLPTEEDFKVKSGNNLNLYLGDRILFKAVPIDGHSELVFSYVEGSSVFREKTLGISSVNNTLLLKTIYAYISSKLFVYFQFLTSSSWGIFFPEVLHKEYLSFPYLESNDQKDELISLVNQFLSPFEEYYKSFTMGEPEINGIILQRLNSLVEEIYDLNTYEKDLIDYVLNVSRYQFDENTSDRIVKKVDMDLNVLEEYVDVFLTEFKNTYEGEYLEVEVYPLNSFIAMNFIFSTKQPDKKNNITFISENNDEKEILKRLANNLSISKVTNNKDSLKNLYIQKDIKGFEKDSFYIIKPNEYKCWHRARAWYDVAEIKEAIEEAELTHLNDTSDVA